MFIYDLIIFYKYNIIHIINIYILLVENHFKLSAAWQHSYAINTIELIIKDEPKNWTQFPCIFSMISLKSLKLEIF